MPFNNGKFNYVRLYGLRSKCKRNRPFVAKLILLYGRYNALTQFPVILLNDMGITYLMSDDAYLDHHCVS